MYQCYCLYYVVKNNKTFIEIKNKGMAVIGELLSNNKIEDPMKFSNGICLNDKEMTIHNYSLWKLLGELKDFNFNDSFICYEKGKKYFYDNYVNNNLEIEDKINNMSFQFNNFWKDKIITIHSIIGDKPNIEKTIYNMGILNAYIRYEKENFYLFEKYLQEENHEIEIIEPLTSTQKDKIGLFVRSGIIQFLREKNPNMTNSDIAKFIIELVSCEKMINPESIRPHLITDISSDKHPFYKVGKKEEYDLILHKYGIKPQADQ